MTITIADGRGALWQWDTGRRVKITDGDGVKQVHYQNKCFGRSVDVDVGVDGTAIIPDELLQDWHTLTAYAYVADDAGGYTKVQVDFAVHKRAKPAGYVYTPTDQMTLQTIQAQIGDLADLTTEAQDTLVAAINEAAASGGGAGSMDLRVADGYIQYSNDGGSTWANLIAVADLKGADGAKGDKGDTGAPGQQGPQGEPGVKGADGAPGIYYGTTQPTGDTHPVWIDPNGTPDELDLSLGLTSATVGQIAKITAVDSDGKPTAWAPVDMPSGGGGSGETETWEKVAEVTTTEVAASLRVTFDACKAVYVEFQWGGVEDSLGNIYIAPNVGDTFYTSESRAAAAKVTTSTSKKRGYTFVAIDTRMGANWVAKSGTLSRGDGTFGDITPGDDMNCSIGAEGNCLFSKMHEFFFRTDGKQLSDGVKSITAYGAGMAIGTTLSVWGIKK